MKFLSFEYLILNYLKIWISYNYVIISMLLYQLSGKMNQHRFIKYIKKINIKLYIM